MVTGADGSRHQTVSVSRLVRERERALHRQQHSTAYDVGIPGMPSIIFRLLTEGYRENKK